jgi:hypothetical protein
MMNRECDVCRSKEKIVYPRYEVTSSHIMSFKVCEFTDGVIPSNLKYCCNDCYDKSKEIE